MNAPIIQDIKRLLAYTVAMGLMVLAVVGLVVVSNSRAARHDMSEYVLVGVFFSWGLLALVAARSDYRGGIWSWMGRLFFGCGVLGVVSVFEFSKPGDNLPVIPLLIVLGCLLLGATFAKLGLNRHNQKKQNALFRADDEPSPRVFTRSVKYVPWWLGLAFGIFYIWHYFDTATRLTNFQKECREAGLSTSWKELSEQYAQTPAPQNAAGIYLQALTNFTVADVTLAYRLATNTLRNSNAPLENRQLSTQIDDILFRNRTNVALLHEALRFPDCRYPLDFRTGPDAFMPHLRSVQTGAELLFLESERYGCARNGQAAVDSLVALLQLADSLAKEPFTQSKHIRTWCNWLALASLETVLERTALRDSELLRMDRAIRKTEATPDVAAALGGQICEAMDADPNRAIDIIVGSERSFPNIFAAATGKTLSLLTDRQYADKLYCGRTLCAYIKALNNPYPLRLKMVPDWDATVTHSMHFGYGISFVVLSKEESLLREDAVNCARLRIVQLVLAVERFRAANGGQVPKKLADLRPQFTQSLPEDPFVGGPLRYELFAKGYAVCSEGWISGKAQKAGNEIRMTIARAAKDDLANAVAP